jgi:hypothetical protein
MECPWLLLMLCCNVLIMITTFRSLCLSGDVLVIMFIWWCFIVMFLCQCNGVVSVVMDF